MAFQLSVNLSSHVSVLLCKVLYSFASNVFFFFFSFSKPVSSHIYFFLCKTWPNFYFFMTFPFAVYFPQRSHLSQFITWTHFSFLKFIFLVFLIFLLLSLKFRIYSCVVGSNVLFPKEISLWFFTRLTKGIWVSLFF